MICLTGYMIVNISKILTINTLCQFFRIKFSSSQEALEVSEMQF